MNYQDIAFYTVVCAAIGFFIRGFVLERNLTDAQENLDLERHYVKMRQERIDSLLLERNRCVGIIETLHGGKRIAKKLKREWGIPIALMRPEYNPPSMSMEYRPDEEDEELGV